MISDCKGKEYTACIGNFDGVHLGHQALIQRTLEISSATGTIPLVITFVPHPMQVLNKDTDIKLLTTVSQRDSLFEHYGIHEQLTIPFVEEFYRKSPDEFIEYLNTCHIHTLICGFDWTFGYRGEGTVEYLTASKLKNFNVEVVEPVTYRKSKISSTRIIKDIKAGKIKQALKMLGHSYAAGCIADNGKLISKENVLPEKGTYQCRFNGMTTLINVNSCTLQFTDERFIEFIDRFSDC